MSELTQLINASEYAPIGSLLVLNVGGIDLYTDKNGFKWLKTGVVTLDDTTYPDGVFSKTNFPFSVLETNEDLIFSSISIGTHYDIKFNSNGTRVFILGPSDDIYQINLSTAWDVSTGSTTVADEQHNFTTQNSRMTGFTFNDDGTKLYLVADDSLTQKVYTYDLSTAWDLSNVSYDTVVDFKSLGADITAIEGVQFNDDGTKFYVWCNSSDKIAQFSCSTAYDVSTLSHDKDASIVGVTGDAKSIKFSPDGSNLYISYSYDIKVMGLSTDWDISTLSYDTDDVLRQSFAYNTEGSLIGGLCFNDDGSKLYFWKDSVDSIRTITPYHSKLAIGNGNLITEEETGIPYYVRIK